MEGELKKALNEIANQHSFAKSVDIESLLTGRGKKYRRKQKKIHVSTVLVCTFLIVMSFLYDIPMGITNLFKGEDVEHIYSDYLIHNNYYYIPTQETLTSIDLNEEIGTVKRIGNWVYLKEGDTQLFIPGTKYYSIKGTPDSEKIAAEIWGGTKQEPKIVGYQVLERKEALEKINENMIGSAKGDKKEIEIALININKHVPFFHLLKSLELEPVLVELDNDGNHFAVLTHYAPAENSENNTKFIFVTQYNKGYKNHSNNFEDFKHNASKPLSNFTVNGIKWTQYESEQSSYFKGVRNGVIFEVSSQVFTPEEVKGYLETIDKY